MGNCLRCGKHFIDRSNNKVNEKKFCSFLCQSRFNARKHYNISKDDLKYKEKRNNQFRKWYLRNKDRQYRNISRNYYKSKAKWHCRNITSRIIRGESYTKLEIPEKYCKKCNSIVNLTIHHEVYPRYAANIREAIMNRKIYYLCRKCHTKTS